MTGFSVTTARNERIRFRFYQDAAPLTVRAFAKTLPFTQTFLHARVSGQEVWTDKAPPLDVIQENASVFTGPGEVVIGPKNAARTKTAGAMGIYYGEGRGLDACNIFACVEAEDLLLLQQLGNRIWTEGAEALTFELIS